MCDKLFPPMKSQIRCLHCFVIYFYMNDNIKIQPPPILTTTSIKFKTTITPSAYT